jgi:glutathionylspermidine synthase
MEDQQVVAYLARVLASRGFTPHLVDPAGLMWRDGVATLAGDHSANAATTSLAAVVRFYQAEWLARLPRHVREPLLTTSRTPVVNPVASVLTESKRFPLAWADLRTTLATWRRLLPETRDPRDAPWRTDDAWLIKSAFCNTGDTVAAAGLVPPRAWRAARRSAWLFPGGWVAQRRFETLPIDTPSGAAMYPCVGVYTVNGKAAGAYVRLSRGPVVDYRAVDVALLVRDEGGRP